MLYLTNYILSNLITFIKRHIAAYMEKGMKGKDE